MSDMTFVNIANLVEANGKTVRQNNEAKGHTIPLGSLVEIHGLDSEDSLESEQLDGLRLFVVDHSRDCDGSPLYSLSFNKHAAKDRDEANVELAALDKHDMSYNLLKHCRAIALGSITGGYSDESLKVIK